MLDSAEVSPPGECDEEDGFQTDFETDEDFDESLVLGVDDPENGGSCEDSEDRGKDEFSDQGVVEGFSVLDDGEDVAGDEEGEQKSERRLRAEWGVCESDGDHRNDDESESRAESALAEPDEKDRKCNEQPRPGHVESVRFGGWVYKGHGWG